MDPAAVFEGVGTWVAKHGLEPEPAREILVMSGDKDVCGDTGASRLAASADSDDVPVRLTSEPGRVLRDDDRGIDPVPTTILMVIITIILAAIQYLKIEWSLAPRP